MDSKNQQNQQIKNEIAKLSEDTIGELQDFVENEEQGSEEDINRLLQNLQGKKSASTHNTYKYALKDFAKFFIRENHDKIVRELGTKTIGSSDIDKYLTQILAIFLALTKSKGLITVSNYLSYLRGEYNSGKKIKVQSTSTIYTKLTVLKNYVRQVRAVNEMLPGDKQEWNLDDLKAHKVENKKVPGPSQKQFSKLLEYFINLESLALQHNNYIDLRNSLLFFILSFTGLRISGALSIDIEDIDFENETIKPFLKGKGEIKEEFSIATFLKEKIEQFLKLDGRKFGPLFINKDQIKESTTGNRLRRESGYRIINELCEKAGVKNIHPHKFRHFAASEALLASDDDVMGAMEFTKHTSQKVFMGYLDKRKNKQKIIAEKFIENWKPEMETISERGNTEHENKSTESKS